MGKDSGKALTIFLILIAVILVSLTAISVFLLVKQVQLRESAEYSLAQLKTAESTLRAELEQIKQDRDLLQQKSQESEAKIESLLEELDLAEGVRDEVKKENRELKDSMEQLKVKNKEISQKLASQEEDTAVRISDLQQQLDDARRMNTELEQQRQSLEEEYNALKAKISDQEAAALDALGIQDADSVSVDSPADVDLNEIVVSHADAQNSGEVVSVDHEAEFVIISLGQRQGVAVDSTLAVYNQNRYLGDVVITKVLPEMSAADFVPPLTSRDISEGDLAKIKE